MSERPNSIQQQADFAEVLRQLRVQQDTGQALAGELVAHLVAANFAILGPQPNSPSASIIRAVAAQAARWTGIILNPGPKGSFVDFVQNVGANIVNFRLDTLAGLAGYADDGALAYSFQNPTRASTSRLNLASGTAFLSGISIVPASQAHDAAFPFFIPPGSVGVFAGAGLNQPNTFLFNVRDAG